MKDGRVRRGFIDAAGVRPGRRANAQAVEDIVMAITCCGLGRRDVRLDRAGRLGNCRAVEHPASEARGEKRSDHMHFHCVVLPWRPFYAWTAGVPPALSLLRRGSGRDARGPRVEHFRITLGPSSLARTVRARNRLNEKTIGAASPGPPT